MEIVKISGFTVSERNCNKILTTLYEERDSIGKKIDRAMMIGDDLLQTELEAKYNQTCDTIAQLCDYRRTHNCLTEGDPGFSFY